MSEFHRLAAEHEGRRGSTIDSDEGGGYLRIPQIPVIELTTTSVTINPVSTKSRAVQASEAQAAYIQGLARTHFPSFVEQVVRATDRPFVQSIYEAHVPAYHRGRICLIGDASTLARPHTGAGSVKAMTDALALSKALATQESVEAALQRWDDEQCTAGNQLVSLGQALGEALVTRVPDWGAMNPATMESWYAGVIAGKNWYQINEIPKPR